jgi:RNA polymerase sigma-70 factor (ECF subfamily)
MTFSALEQSLPTVKAPLASTAPDGPDANARRISSAVGRGDEAAFEELYDTYRARLFRFALVLGRGDEALAQEVVQNAFVTAAAKLRKVESDEHLWNWLARVARQHLSKAWRKERTDPALLGITDLDEHPQESQSDSLMEERLGAALLELPVEDRQLIEWFYFEHLSHKDIATLLNTTAKAVSSRLERARAHLRSTLKRSISHEI